MKSFLIKASVLLATFSNDVFAEPLSGRPYVRDADTIVISRRSIRLHGVDAPELYTRYGRLAAEFLHELLWGRSVRCELEDAVEETATLGICYIEIDGNTVDIGAALISAGFALDCRAISGGRYSSLEQPDARSRIGPADYC